MDKRKLKVKTNIESNLLSVIQKKKSRMNKIPMGSRSVQELDMSSTTMMYISAT